MTTGPPRRILVTGAEGFVGTHLVQTLRGDLPGADLHVTRFDVTDESAVAEAVRACRPDACVHLAGVSAIQAAISDPDLAWRVNLHGTLTLARILSEAAPGCTLLFSSTADAYGRSFKSGLSLDESAPLNPMNMYSATKAAADLALGAMSDQGIRIIRARPFNHIGPGQTVNFVVSAFARQIALIRARRQRPVIQVGALDPSRDFLDVRDVCACYSQCLQQADQVPTGAVLNISSGQPRRIADVLGDLLDLAGIEVEVEVDAARIRKSEIPSAAGDSTAVRTLLGWSPQIAWRQTLADILADWQTRIGAEPA